MYRDQLEKSVEVQNNLDKLKEKRVNRYMYGEMLKQLVSLKPNVSLEPKRQLVSASPNNQKRKLRSKELEELKKKKEIGANYLKFSIDVGKELMMSPQVNLKSDIKNTLGSLDGRHIQQVQAKKKRTKEEIKSMYSVHDIFASKDKMADDKGNNYQRIATLRKADKFTSPETQSLVVKAIKDIDRELKLKERQIKNGVEKGENIDLEYLRSIKTKIEVINQRLNSKLENFEAVRHEKKSQEKQIKYGVKSKAEELRPLRAKSAMRPFLKTTQQRNTPPVSASRPRPPNGTEAKTLIQAKLKTERVSSEEKQTITRDSIPDNLQKPARKASPDVHKPKDNSKKLDPSNIRPSGIPEQDTEKLKIKTKQPISQSNQQQEEEDSYDDANLDRKKSKELIVPEPESKTYESFDDRHKNPESPNPSVFKNNRQGMAKEDKEHPLIKRLSEDLDADPSESVSVSHHKRHQQELGEYFSKKTNERRVSGHIETNKASIDNEF